MPDNPELFDYEFDSGMPLPPLSDPVVSEIFRNAEVSGLAMRELINAVLTDSGDRPIREVISVVPQEFHPDAQARSYRVDVTARTQDNEVVIFEVQLSTLLVTNERSLLYAEQTIGENAAKGDKWKNVVAYMPRVLVLNFLNFDLRKDGQNFHQVAELVYREGPRELASDRFAIHNIELKKFRKTEPDLAKPLHCWLRAVCKAQDDKKSLKEVVGMDAELRSFAANNPGFAQFVDRYEFASSNRTTRAAYRKWEALRNLDLLERQRQNAESWKGGKAEGFVQMIKGLLLLNLPEDTVWQAAKNAGVTRAQYDRLRRETDAK
jgi:hypothetical protein